MKIYIVAHENITFPEAYQKVEIMKEDIDKVTLYMLGVLIVLFFTFLGFLFLIISKKIK